MLGKKKDRKNWNVPFILIKSSVEFDQLPEDKKAQEIHQITKKQKKQEIIIVPKIQKLQGAQLCVQRPSQMSYNYIKVHKSTNLPLPNSYQLNEVEIHFTDCNLLKFGISRQTFAKILIKLEKQSLIKGLQFDCTQILWKILEEDGIKRPRRLRKKNDIDFSEIFKRIFSFWKKKRVINGYGNFPFYRPLWAKNDLAGGPFKSREQDRICLRNRTPKMESAQIQQIIMQDLLKLKELGLLIIKRQQYQILSIKNLIDNISNFQMGKKQDKSSKGRNISKEKGNDSFSQEEEKKNQKIRQKTKKIKKEQKKRSSRIKFNQKTKKKNNQQFNDSQQMSEEQYGSKTTIKKRYTRAAIKAFAEDQANQEYYSLAARKYYTRGNYKNDNQSLSSSFEASLDKPIANIITRFKNRNNPK